MLHTIHFICPVTTNSVSQLQNHCLAALSQGATEINIHISSRGGETDCGFAAYSFLKSLPIKVRTHNISNVESIANIIFLAGSERTANPESRFLIHPLAWSFSGQVDHYRLRELVKCLDNDLNRFVNIFLDEVSHDIDWFSTIEKSTVFTTEDAMNCGIVNIKKIAKLQPNGVNWYVSC
nr:MULTISPECIES: ATP-dependent Clp protease proteolytic subunit [unclassified Providencia]